ncbi:hypothetical protein GCM10007354_23810 [Acinetobacter courvalinii]|uniref:Uncharacterized protein n=1 Tax=Acinetobacter courvalinii TaxID=280147 RepID=A0ABD0A955_9GAMM|nr:hypothetical protein GCM10007354_23810 [Acinetobacter courvalinii]
MIDDEPQLITNTDIATFEHLTDFKFYDEHSDLAAMHEQWNQAQCFNMGCHLGEDRL